MMMRHLVWKDAQTIRPLMVAAVVGIVLLHLTVVLVGAMTATSFDDMAGIFVSLWILMPNLVALGAPALLVGGEEEGGTLNWLRTLPVRWQQVVDSKFLVALGAVAATWVTASIMLAIALSTAGSLGSVPREMLAAGGVLQLVFFSLLLLSTGFATAYLFRSPVTALIAVIPSIILVNVIAMNVGGWIVGGRFPRTPFAASGSAGRWAMLVAAGIGALVLVWIVQRLLGRRRLTKKQGSIVSRWKSSPSVAAYRPPARAGSDRPSEVGALLWQQWSQMRWPGLMLTALVALFFVVYFGVEINSSRRSGGWRIVSEFAPLVTVLGGCWLGSLAFYGDNVRRRCDFLADRGVSPGHVWWTRLAPSALFITILLTLAISLHCLPANWRVAEENATTWEHVMVVPCLLLVSFAFGQLVGQWVSRPTLAFFGTPAYGLLSCMALSILYSTIYVSYFWTILLMVPVLLFATWRLTSRWLDNRIDGGFHGRVVAYTALAVVVPILTIVGQRCATIPAEMTSWRSEMLAIDHPALTSRDGPRGDWVLLLREIQSTPPRLDDDPSALREYIQALEQQVAADGAGEFMSVYAVDEHIRPEIAVVTQDVVRLRQTSIRLLLKWGRMIREDIAGGRVSVWPAIQSAAYAESLAARGLLQLNGELGATPELAELVALMPSSELRQRSRRIGLIKEWRHYQQTPWNREVGGRERYGKGFMGNAMAYNVSRLPFERTRSDRFIDLATRRSLDQLEAGLPPLDSTQTTETNVLWSEARGPRRSLDEPVRQFLPWPNDSDTLIDAVRLRYAAASTQP